MAHKASYQTWQLSEAPSEGGVIITFPLDVRNLGGLLASTALRGVYTLKVTKKIRGLLGFLEAKVMLPSVQNVSSLFVLSFLDKAFFVCLFINKCHSPQSPLVSKCLLWKFIVKPHSQLFGKCVPVLSKIYGDFKTRKHWGISKF